MTLTREELEAAVRSVLLCMPGSRLSRRLWILSTPVRGWSCLSEQLFLFHLDRIGGRLHQTDDRPLSTHLADVSGRQ
jgi:hypothetical protein